MGKAQRFLFLFFIFVFAILNSITAQQNANQPDTFFLAKKRGLLGKLGKSMVTSNWHDVPQKTENQFIQFKGKIIRFIIIKRLGFQNNINDSTVNDYNLGVRLANTFHKNSKDKTILNNLFFKEDSRVYPYLISDNERYLRTLPYLQDAKIVIKYIPKSTDSVDVIVFTKDVFSISGNIVINDKTSGRIEVQEENFAGSGTRVALSSLYDIPRTPQNAFSASINRRNIKGSFVNWTTGFSNFSQAFNSGQREETNYFTKIEKPLVTPFIPSTGALELGYYKTNNAYNTDSIYKTIMQYKYYNIDGWIGYSLDSKRAVFANRETRIHNFIAIRAFDQHFLSVPIVNNDSFDYRYTNSLGILTSINIFKQINYTTNFIYGFGRNEDVPQGFSIALTGGFATQQNPGYIANKILKRPYAGLDFGLTNFIHSGFFSNYTFRLGSFFNHQRFEDMDLLFNVDHFTKLKKINNYWLHRMFITANVTSQINPVFSAPLFLNSDYGLPYFNAQNSNYDFRSTLKLESVWYNTKKILGFKFAPFVFSDFCLLKNYKQTFDKNDLFTAIGGGVRTRNENLVFGTVELRAFYFPRTNGNMNGWQIQLNSNIQFKYNSIFIKRPQFIIDN